MSLIPETPVEDSAELLKNLQRQSAQNTEALSSQKSRLQEIKEQITALKACQQVIDDVKHRYYGLLTEQMIISELAHSEQFVTNLDSEIEAFTATKDKGGEKPKA